LRWAIENGCPCDESIYLSATLNGHLKILKWAFGSDYPRNKEFYLDVIKKMLFWWF
jgi:hypothetical protein